MDTFAKNLTFYLHVTMLNSRDHYTQKITSLSELVAYQKNPLIHTCWYGPKSSDFLDLQDVIHPTGIVSCYSSTLNSSIPLLTYDGIGERYKFSIDDLADHFVTNGRFEEFAKRNNITSILPYDSNPQLEIFCQQNNIHILSSLESTKNLLRDKTKIDEISRAIGLDTIPGIPGIIDEFEFESLTTMFGLPLFLHFAEGAGGTGNWIVYTKDEFENVKKQQKGKRLNVKKFFNGKTCTIDICVTPAAIFCGNLEEEIIGEEPLNSNPTEYVGSSWFENGYSYEIRRRILNIGLALGKYVRSRGFLGCFHPDFLVGDGDDIYLTELNMRFGGSCGAYNKIQILNNRIPITLLHSIAFSDSAPSLDSEKINNENLKPLNYGFMVLKNNFNKPVTIPHKFKSGIYSIAKNKILYTNKTKLLDMRDAETIFVSGLPESNKDTIIHKGAYMFEVITKFPISDSKSNLNSVGRNLAQRLYSNFIGDECSVQYD